MSARLIRADFLTAALDILVLSKILNNTIHPDSKKAIAMANVGSIDRGARFLAGLVLIALSFLPPSAPIFADFGLWRWVLAAVGAVLIVTAALRICPAYTLLGLNTCPRR
jgi:predicted membrane-bound dolichyl-phosphate-mannose-protein mannosyltransferase